MLHSEVHIENIFGKIANECVRTLSALVNLNGPDQPHVGPPPTCMGLGAVFKLSLGPLFFPWAVLEVFVCCSSLSVYGSAGSEAGSVGLFGRSIVTYGLKSDLPHHCHNGLWLFGLLVGCGQHLRVCTACVLWDWALPCEALLLMLYQLALQPVRYIHCKEWISRYGMAFHKHHLFNFLFYIDFFFFFLFDIRINSYHLCQ